MTDAELKNSFGFTKNDYLGAKSTLCTGCGHDSVTQHIVSALYKSDVHPFDIVKLSGIGCSSKTTNYFLNQSHGFNSIHGRMAALATGAKIANRNLNVIGISGDGDSASIGLGGLLHLFRRNLPMVYIVENNSVYGLTKGQFSATAEIKSYKKNGHSNNFQAMDLCALAIEAGCSFVARSFSGDAKQLVPLIRAAMKHDGTAFIDVLSPCITYANHEGSHASYDYVKDHKVSLQDLGYISERSEISVDYEAGETVEVQMADGSILLLKKLENDYDFSNRSLALDRLFKAKEGQQILTGLIYYQGNQDSLLKSMDLGTTPLTELSTNHLRPGASDLNEILKGYK